MARVKKYDVDEVFRIKNGDGKEVWAKIVFRSVKPPKVRFVTRASNRGRYTQKPVEATLPAFRKLLVAD